MIQKMLHHVWLGPNEIPERDLVWIGAAQRAVRRNSEDWQCVLWVNSKTNASRYSDLGASLVPELFNQQMFNEIPTLFKGNTVYVVQSDIVRMEMICRYGGVYIDTDVELFKPLGPLLDGVELAYANEWGESPGNYCFAAKANHPAMWTCLRELEGHFNQMKQGGRVQKDVLGLAGPIYLSRQLLKYQPVIWPHRVFNPLCYMQNPDKVVKWPECSYGNHRYDGKWYERQKTDPAEFPRMEYLP
ncbi:MAG: glycosyltransferase family 32 protein [Acetobacteraceae bacterium]